MSELVKGYLEGDWTPENQPVLFGNFINYSFPAGIEPGAESVFDSEFHKLNCTHSSKYVSDPGVDKFFMDNNAEGSAWHVDNLRAGDMLLIPFGDLPPSLANYRGTALFCTDWESKLSFLPQAKFKPVFVVTRKLLRLGGHPFTIGWMCLALESIPKISLSINPAGKLYDGAQFFAAHELQGHFVVMTAQLNRGLLIWQRVQGKEIPVSALPMSDGNFEVRVLLPEVTNGISATDLRLQSFGKFDSPSFLRVKSARVE
jgi:hypothetical protein